MPSEKPPTFFLRHIGQPRHLDDVVHALLGNAVRGGHGQQVVVGRAAGVDGLGVQQRADIAQRRARAGRTGAPLTVTVPDVGRSSPMIMRMVVDLPAPFGPRKPVTRPASTVKLTPATAVFSP